MISVERHQERDDFIRRCIAAGMRLSPDNRVITPLGHRNPVRSTARRKGYWKTTLTLDGVTEVFTTARIVCWLAHGPPSEGCVVDHIDGNTRNDHPNNLRWVTRSENSSNVDPRVNEKRSAHAVAVAGARTKRGFALTDDEVVQIRRLAATWPHEAIANHFGVGTSTISRIVTGAAHKRAGRAPQVQELTWAQAVGLAAELEARGYRLIDLSADDAAA